MPSRCRGPVAAAFGTETPQRSCSLVLSSSLLRISIWRLVASLQVSCCRACTSARPYGCSVAVYMTTPTRGVCDACCARRGDWPSGGSAAKKRDGFPASHVRAGQGSRSDQTITLKGVWYVLQLMSALGHNGH